ncbi:MAG: hypothetical protein WDO19_09515 [Bacteroidota bacterium]
MPVAKRTEAPKTIAVQPNDIVSLTIIIGNAQIGSSTVKFKFTSAILGKGEIKDLVIGKGSDIAGKTLRIATRVLDANPASDKVSITHHFDNASPADTEYDDEIAEGQDVFTLLVDYALV